MIWWSRSKPTCRLIAKDKALAFQQTMGRSVTLRERKLRFFDLFTLGKMLRDVRFLANEFQEIGSLTGAVLILGNPALIGISAMGTLLWVCTAVMTAFIYVI